MIRNYIKTALRNLLKNKIYSLINVIGLSIGLACSIMVMLYLKNEFTHDNMHVHKKDIQRVAFKLTMPNGMEKSAVITAGVGPTLVDEFPEVESMVRVRYPQQGFFTYQDINYHAEDVSFADSTFFKIFSFKLLSGNKDNVLKDPYTVVLTESLAEKIFKDEDPIGKVVKWNNGYTAVVTGIAADCPENSSIQFEAIISFTTLYKLPNQYLGWNGGNSYYTYLKLNSNASIENLKPKLPDLLEKEINYMYRPAGWLIELEFDRMDKIHLYSEIRTATSGDLKKLWIIGLIGALVLIIAVFNFINLSTAKSSKRSVEIGVRKVLGADRRMVARQFLSEAVLFSLISFVLSLILIEIFQPQFERYVGDYELYTQANLGFILFLIAFAIFIGLLAGIYPAAFIARFKPIASLKGNAVQTKGKPILRNFLVVVQFVISAVIITYTLVMYLQLVFVQQKDLKFDSSQTIILHMPSQKAIEAYPILKSELEQIANVQSVASADNLVGRSVQRNGYYPEGVKNPMIMQFLAADEDLKDVLKLELIEGRYFSDSYGTDDSAYVINESLAKMMKWDQAVGKKIHRNGWNHVIGVVKDFHAESIEKEISPLIIGKAKKRDNQVVYVKLNSREFQQTSELIGQKWHKVLPNEPISIEFYDELLRDNYTELRKSFRIMGSIAILAILIACLGLYGLAIFIVERRQREIGIRKVFGASTFTVGKLIVIDFVKWILIANIIAMPFSYFYGNKFLQTFPYVANIGITPYMASLILSVCIALITIMIQIIRLSKTNPIETLKHE